MGMGGDGRFVWHGDDRDRKRRPIEQLTEEDLEGPGEVEEDVAPGPWRNLRRGFQYLKDAGEPFRGWDMGGGDLGEGCGTVFTAIVVLFLGSIVALLLIFAVLDIIAAVVAILAAVTPVLLRRVRDLAGSLHGWRLALAIEGAVIVAMLVVLAVRRFH